ncbi:hypothetical protein [Pedobacter nototheniae]|uniref:hypothetical protein n=1 Tax=Pedobacter nototheniae TaxID=2488994 RepID=UPI00292CF203|nr:hypothetical protein [Pedobacter nototheniae]
MVKFLKITAAIFVLLLIFFVGTFKYRQYKGNRLLIPANVSGLIKINTDEIYKSIGLNMVSNLGYYLKSGEKKISNIEAKNFDTGLDVPAALYFYTIAGKSNDLLFSRLEIKDSVAFKNFITKALSLNPVKNIGNGTYTTSSKDNRLSISYNKTAVALSYSFRTEDSEQLRLDILNQKNFIKVSQSNFNKVNDYRDHILFTNQENLSKLNFNSGNIDFSHEFTTKILIPGEKPSHRVFNTDNTMTFWLNARLEKTGNKLFKLNDFTVERDSILKYYKDYLDVEWTNSTQQVDSVITYDYNDDFEKVEKITLQKHDVPNLIINIAANPNGLKNYLQQQNFIIADRNIVNKAVFPLYKLFVRNERKNLIFSTQKNQRIIFEQAQASDFFYLNVNFTKLNKQISLPIFSNQVKSVKTLEVKGKAMGNNKVKIEGELKLVNQDINALYQLLKLF